MAQVAFMGDTGQGVGYSWNCWLLELAQQGNEGQPALKGHAGLEPRHGSRGADTI